MALKLRKNENHLSKGIVNPYVIILLIVAAALVLSGSVSLFPTGGSGIELVTVATTTTSVLPDVSITTTTIFPFGSVIDCSNLNDYCRFRGYNRGVCASGCSANWVNIEDVLRPADMYAGGLVGCCENR